MARNGNGNGVNGVNGNGKNGINGLIDEDGYSKLSWKEYQSKVKQIWDDIPHGESKWPVIKAKLGMARWDGIEYTINSNKDTKLGFQRKKVSTRNKNAEQFIKNRKENEKFTDITSEEAAKDWKKKNITQWNVGTKEDPIPSNPTGEKLVKGTDDYNKYFRRYEHRIKVADPFWKTDHGLDYLSGDPENLTYTTKAQWDAKDAGEMAHGKSHIFDVDQHTGDVVYTPRKGFDPHDAKFNKYTFGQKLAEESQKVAKVARKVKPLTKLIPIVGLGMVGIDAKARTQEAIENPTWQNKTQAALGGAELALEGFETATGGVGAVVTTPLQIGLMVANQLVHQTEDEFQRGPRNWQARLDARRGVR